MNLERLEDTPVSQTLINHLLQIAKEDEGSDFHKSFCEAWEKAFGNEGEPKKDYRKTELPVLLSDDL